MEYFGVIVKISTIVKISIGIRDNFLILVERTIITLMKILEQFSDILEKLTELRKLGNYVEAKELLFSTIMLLENQKSESKSDDEINTIQYYKARLLSNLSAIHHETGETKASVDVIKQALLLATELTDKKLQAQLIGLLGISLRRAGDIQQSIKVLREAVLKLEEIDELQTANRFKTDLASILMSVGSLEEALQGFQQALDYFKIHTMDLEFLHSISKIATLYDYMGNIDAAIETMQMCLTIPEKKEYLPILINIYGNLSGLFLQLHDIDKAVQYLEKAKSLSEVSTINFQSLHLDIHSIDVMLFKNNYDESLREIELKLTFAEQKKMFTSVVQLFLQGARAQIGKKNYNEAIVMVKKAENISISTSNEIFLLDCYDLLSTISEQDKKLSLAIEYKQKAIWEAKQQHNRRLEKQYTQEIEILQKLFLS